MIWRLLTYHSHFCLRIQKACDRENHKTRLKWNGPVNELISYSSAEDYSNRCHHHPSHHDYPVTVSISPLPLPKPYLISTYLTARHKCIRDVLHPSINSIVIRRIMWSQRKIFYHLFYFCYPPLEKTHQDSTTSKLVGQINSKLNPRRTHDDSFNHELLQLIIIINYYNHEYLYFYILHLSQIGSGHRINTVNQLLEECRDQRSLCYW